MLYVFLITINALITTPHGVVPNLYYPHIFATYQFDIIITCR